MAEAPSNEHEAEQGDNEVNSYELFIAVLSVVSIVNLVLILFPFDPNTHNVLRIVDAGLTVAFFADFLGRLLRASNKGRYFFRQLGWLDLLGSLPFPELRLARVFRVFRVVRLVQPIGVKALLNKFFHDRASSALYSVLLLCLVVIECSSIFVLKAEASSPDRNITNASDAVWWTIVTITTVGYGDKYPTTNPGRIIGVITMVVGVGLFGVLTGYLANSFLAPQRKQQEDKSAEKSGESTTETGASLSQPQQEPTALPASLGLEAKLEQLMAEVTELKRLMQHPVRQLADADHDVSADNHSNTVPSA